ncbi:MAG: radical SAM protein, partial [Candidatus Peregrinibacteria bacterium]|nr:radical SAM protein [Candidatus Peregrinibacteria bacterium]
MDFHPIPKQEGVADLLLINPDFSKNELGMASAPENHLGLNRIAGYLDKKGYKISVIDTTGRKSSTSGPEELGEWLKTHAHQYQTIGFHTNSWNVNHILRALEKAADSLTDKKLLFGGPLPNSEPKKMLELLIEKGLRRVGVVQGLGEKITDEILKKEKLTDVQGLWAFDDGHQKDGEKVALTQEEYEATPFLDLKYNTFYQQYFKPVIDAQDLGRYSMEIIFGSQGLDVNRGCPFNCSYCSVPQYERRLIMYSPKRVVDELEHLAKEAGFFMFTFTNSNIMFYDEEWCTEFCQEIIGRGMGDYINWTAYHHPITLAKLSDKAYDLMRKSGSSTIVFGVQSFEKEVLKKFIRPLNTPELTKVINEKCKRAGMELSVDYITGVPEEDLDIIEEAFNYFAENDIECRNYQLKFYPNTKLPTMNLDLTNHDLVPITGELAPELSAYAVVSKKPNKRSAELDGFIRKANAELIAHRPVRLGKYIVDSPEKAKELYEKEIPDNPNIPEKVKIAMRLSLKDML